MAEPWDAKEAGATLLTAVTEAIEDERVREGREGRVPSDADLARAVLRSPALQDANRNMLDAMMAEYQPKVAGLVAGEAGEVLAPVLLGLYRDLCRLMADYRDDERDVITAMPFAASLDQLFLEKYGVEIPEAAGQLPLPGVEP